MEKEKSDTPLQYNTGDLSTWALKKKHKNPCEALLFTYFTLTPPNVITFLLYLICA